MRVSRPALRYHGGKWKLAPWIIAHMPPHRVYCEPFGGGANVLLRKDRVKAECYNDLDGQIVNVFTMLQDPISAALLKRRLELTPFARVEFDRTYGVPADNIEAACFTIMRSFMGYGTDSTTRSCRTGFRAKMSDHRAFPSAEWANWPEQVPAFIERLRGVLIEKRDAMEVIQRLDSDGTLFYIDPPYLHSSRSSLKGRSSKTHGYMHEMDNDAHIRLANVLHKCAGMVMLSGYRTEIYNDVYGDWICLERKSLADGARPRVECLWMNPAAASHSEGLFVRDACGARS